MKLKWTSKAHSDLRRLCDFLAPVNKPAAIRVVRTLIKALEYPRIGEKLDAFAPKEVRRIFLGAYEIRYEVQAGDIFVLRIWHSREDR
ncbi:MAG: plasmid stabilization protein [Rhizobium sp. 63-7]|nr:MAG: plasmid stabilization protein [Rhizobium sp. 63-7]